jgi:hypothetical protein
MKGEKDKKASYAFRIDPSLMLSVKRKIDKENLKAKTPKERTNLSRKMVDLLTEYVNS